MEAVTAVIEGMGEMGMSPPEAMMAAEIVLWDFMKKALELCKTDEQRAEGRAMAARILARIGGRVEAWPAANIDKKDRM